jgi:hypothetical protein
MIKPDQSISFQPTKWKCPLHGETDATCTIIINDPKREETFCIQCILDHLHEVGLKPLVKVEEDDQQTISTGS